MYKCACIGTSLVKCAGAYARLLNKSLSKTSGKRPTQPHLSAVTIDLLKPIGTRPSSRTPPSRGPGGFSAARTAWTGSFEESELDIGKAVHKTISTIL